MKVLKEKLETLKVLLENTNLQADTDQNKVLLSMFDLLTEMTLKVDTLQEKMDNMSDRLDEMDEDLANLEEEFYHEEDHGFQTEVKCPSCNQTVQITEETLNESGSAFTCPSCHTEIDIEWDSSCGCDEGCECNEDCGCEEKSNDISQNASADRRTCNIEEDGTNHKCCGI